MSLTQKLGEFEAEWNGGAMPLMEVVWKLQKKEYPDSLSVFHEEFGTLRFTKLSPIYYICDRYGPPLRFPDGGVISRSFGSFSLPPKSILGQINYVFDGIIDEVEAVQKVASAKLVKLQAEGAQKMMNKSSKNIPRNIRNQVAQMIGEKKPVLGSYSVLNNITKINASLFKEGGKRKTRRRKIRRLTRKSK